ncbi:MAG: right-handed parallel beta-helix repeat-containing protein [Spirochaetales bacterium]|nr:right-handed parallel beta-helix repeat-containing protein [Spirochaetales bacterium]
MKNPAVSRIIVFPVFCILFIAAPVYSQDPKPVLTVLDFETHGISKEEARLVVDHITSHIVESGKYRVIDRMEREALLKEIEWSVSDCVDTGCQLRLGRMLSASYIIVGSFGTVGDRFMITIKLIDVETGETLGTASQVYIDVNSLIEDSGLFISVFLGVGEGEKPDTAAGEGRFVTVATTEALLKAIGPDVVIRIKEGEYNLSGGYRFQNRHIKWEDNFDGLYPVIRSISNLTLIGEGNVSVVIDPAYGWVMEWKTCSNIGLENITFGHTKPGYCAGGVLRFSVCDTVSIDRCTLYGSGTIGLELDHVDNMLFDFSTIKECTYGLIYISDSAGLRFENSHFRDTGDYTLIGITGGSGKILFQSCDFSGNNGQTMFGIGPECEIVDVNGCDFNGNTSSRFADHRELLSIKECRFSGNHFGDEE